MSQPTMQVKCGWCGKSLGTKSCSAAQAGKVSHGICDKCKDKLLAKQAGGKK